MDAHTKLDSYSKEILIVDDNPTNLLLLKNLLRQQGYEVRCARSGKMALYSAQAFPPDLILLDIMMPEMDGYEVCRRLKASAATAQVPVVFVSALDAATEKEQAFAVGAVDYISKPYQIQDILYKVQQMLIKTPLLVA